MNIQIQENMKGIPISNISSADEISKEINMKVIAIVSGMIVICDKSI